MLQICAQRASALREALEAAKPVLDCIAINGPGDYLTPMANDALARMHKLGE